MSDLASLGIEVDTSSVISAITDLDNLALAESQLNHSSTSLTGALTATETQVGNLGSSFSKLNSIIASLGIAKLTTEISQTMAVVQDLNVRLKSLTKESNDYAASQQFITETAIKQHKSISDLSDNYAKLRVLQNSGIITGNQTKAMLIGLNDASSALGVSNAQLKQSMFGLAQGLSTGKLKAEELNQVMEPMPGLLQAMDKAAAKGGNLVAGEFRRMVLAGEVTSKMFAETMVEALKEFEGQAEAMGNNINAKITDIKNEWFLLVTALEKEGTVPALFNYILDGARNSIKAIREMAGEFAIAAAGIVGFAAAQGVALLSTVLLTEATGALTKALLFVATLNPFSLIVGAITAAYGAAYVYRDALVNVSDYTVKVGHLSEATWLTARNSAVDAVDDILAKYPELARYALKSGELIVTVFDEQWKLFKSDAKKTVNWVIGAFVGMGNAIATVGKGIVSDYSAFFSKIKDMSSALALDFEKSLAGDFSFDSLNEAFNKPLDLTNYLSKAKSDINHAFNADYIGDFTNKSAGYFNEFTSKVSETAADLYQLETAINANAVSAKTLNDEVVGTTGAIKGLTEEGKELAKALAAQEKAYLSTIQGLKKKNILLGEGDRAAYKYSLSLTVLSKEQAAHALFIWDTNKALKESIKTKEDAVKASEKLQEAEGRYLDQQQKMDNFGGDLFFPTVSQSSLDILEKYANTKPNSVLEWDKLTRAMKEQLKVMGEWSGTLKGAFSDLLSDGESFTKNLGDMFDNLIDRMLNSAIEFAANKVIQGLFDKNYGQSLVGVAVGAVAVGASYLLADDGPERPAASRTDQYGDDRAFGYDTQVQADRSARDYYYADSLAQFRNMNINLGIQTTSLTNALTPYKGAITAWADSIGVGLGDIVSGYLPDGVGSYFGDTLGNLSDYIPTNDNLADFVGTIFSSLWGQVVGVFSTGITRATPVLTNAVTEAITPVFTTGVTTAIQGSGLDNAISNAITPALESQGTKGVSGASSSMESLTAVLTAGYGIYSLIASWDELDTGQKVLSTISVLSNTVGAVVTLAANAGIAAVQGLAQSVPIVGWIVAAIINVAQTVIKFVNGDWKGGLDQLFTGGLDEGLSKVMGFSVTDTLMFGMTKRREPELEIFTGQQGSGSVRNRLSDDDPIFTSSSKRSATAGVDTDLGALSFRTGNIGSLGEDSIRSMFTDMLLVMRDMDNAVVEGINKADVLAGESGQTMAFYNKWLEANTITFRDGFEGVDVASMIDQRYSAIADVFGESGTKAGEAFSKWFDFFTDKFGAENTLGIFGNVAAQLETLMEFPEELFIFLDDSMKDFELGVSADDAMKDMTSIINSFSNLKYGFEALGETDFSDAEIVLFLARANNMSFGVDVIASSLLQYGVLLKKTNTDISDGINELFTFVDGMDLSKAMQSAFFSTVGSMSSLANSLNIGTTKEDLLGIAGIVDTRGRANLDSDASLSLQEQAVKYGGLSVTEARAKIEEMGLHLGDAILDVVNDVMFLENTFITFGSSLSDSEKELTAGLVEMSSDFIEALGGIEDAQKQISQLSGYYLSEAEQSSNSIKIHQARADSIQENLGATGVNFNNFWSRFDAVRPTATAEELAGWIQLGNEYGAINELGQQRTDVLKAEGDATIQATLEATKLIGALSSMQSATATLTGMFGTSEQALQSTIDNSNFTVSALSSKLGVSGINKDNFLEEFNAKKDSLTDSQIDMWLRMGGALNDADKAGEQLISNFDTMGKSVDDFAGLMLNLVTVMNTGVGISPDAVATMFEGGRDEATTAFDKFYTGFYSDEERAQSEFDIATNAMNKGIESLGVAGLNKDNFREQFEKAQAGGLINKDNIKDILGVGNLIIDANNAGDALDKFKNDVKEVSKSFKDFVDYGATLLGISSINAGDVAGMFKDGEQGAQDKFGVYFDTFFTEQERAQAKADSTNKLMLAGIASLGVNGLTKDNFREQFEAAQEKGLINGDNLEGFLDVAGLIADSNEANEALSGLSEEIKALGNQFVNFVSDGMALMGLVSSDSSAQSVADMFEGGAEEAQQKWSFFFDHFYTDIERAGNISTQSAKRSKAAIKSLNIPGLTKDTFRDVFTSMLNAGELSAEQQLLWLDVAESIGLANDSAQDFVNTLSTGFDKILGTQDKTFEKQIDYLNDIAAYVDSLFVSDQLSPLTNEQQLNEARDQVVKQFNLAESGNLDALQSLPGFVDTYLQKAQTFYSSSQQYTDIFNNVTSHLKELTSKAVTAKPTGDELLSNAIVQQTLDLVVSSKGDAQEIIAAIKQSFTSQQIDDNRLFQEIFVDQLSRRGLDDVNISNFAEKFAKFSKLDNITDEMANFANNTRDYYNEFSPDKITTTILASETIDELTAGDELVKENITTTIGAITLTNTGVEGLNTAVDATNSTVNTLTSQLSAVATEIGNINSDTNENINNLVSVTESILAGLQSVGREGITGNDKTRHVDKESNGISDQRIKDFVGANSGNNKAIYEAATANNISSSRLASVMGWQQSDVLKWAGDNGLPRFAAGGITNGISLAGEAGQEAIIPVPSGVVRAQVTGNSNKEVVEELRLSREELKMLREEVKQLREERLDNDEDQIITMHETSNNNAKQVGDKIAKTPKTEALA